MVRDEKSYLIEIITDLGVNMNELSHRLKIPRQTFNLQKKKESSARIDMAIKTIAELNSLLDINLTLDDVYGVTDYRLKIAHLEEIDESIYESKAPAMYSMLDANGGDLIKKKYRDCFAEITRALKVDKKIFCEASGIVRSYFDNYMYKRNSMRAKFGIACMEALNSLYDINLTLNDMYGLTDYKLKLKHLETAQMTSDANDVNLNTMVKYIQNGQYAINVNSEQLRIKTIENIGDALAFGVFNKVIVTSKMLSLETKGISGVTNDIKHNEYIVSGASYVQALADLFLNTNENHRYYLDLNVIYNNFEHNDALINFCKCIDNETAVKYNFVKCSDIFYEETLYARVLDYAKTKTTNEGEIFRLHGVFWNIFVKIKNTFIQTKKLKNSYTEHSILKCQEILNK